MFHRLKKYILTAGKVVDILGPDVIFQPGMILQKDLDTEAGKVRFAARYDGKGTFTIKVASAKQEIWTGQIDVSDNFPGIEGFVFGLEGIKPSGPQSAGQDHLGGTLQVAEVDKTPEFGEDLASVQQIPHVDEVWVMNCFVEQDNGVEIRYRPADSYGVTYGAPRILGRDDFMEIFTEISSSVFQLAVRVIEVGTDSVTYIRLDAKRQPSGENRVTKLGSFVASFIPEAACY